MPCASQMPQRVCVCARPNLPTPDPAHTSCAEEFLLVSSVGWTVAASKIMISQIQTHCVDIYCINADWDDVFLIKLMFF